MRYDSAGIDPDRDFATFASETARAVREIARGRRYDVVLDHHEDPDARGFYLYQYADRDTRPTRGLIAKVRAMGFPVEQDVRMVILRTRDGLIEAPRWGLWYMRASRRLSMTNWLRLEGAAKVYTVETPTRLPFDDRLLLHRTAFAELLSSALPGRRQVSSRSDPVVLVTGASGFVGGAVVRHLREKGMPVRCLVRDSTRAEALAWLRPPVQIHVGDITDPGTLVGAMTGAGIVFHCAGLNSFWEPDRRAFDRVNVEGTRAVMRAALEARVRKVVHVSTVMAYGFPDRMPFAADSLPGPHMSEYARSKHEGDEAAWDISRSKGLPLVVVHLAAVVGRGDPKSVMQIRDFVQGRVPVLLRSENRFTYVAIDDAARAIIAAGLAEGNAGTRYLVGSQRLTTTEYFQLISDLSGVAMPRVSIGRGAAMTLARLLTAWAAVVRRPPLLPLDLMRTQFRGSLLFDGDSAAAALGITYAPIRAPLADAVEDARRP